MQTRGRRFRLGLLVLGTGGLFIAMVAFILQGSLRSSRVSYHILFEENVKGMVVGSKVNFQGVPIGQVADIRFLKGRTLVEIAIDPQRAEIQNQTRARLDRLLVTGQVTVELEGWDALGRRLAPGSQIEPKQDPLQSLARTVPEVLDQVGRLVDHLDGVVRRFDALLGDANQQRFAAILGNVERATAPLATRLEASLHSVDELLAQTRASVAAVERSVVGVADATGPVATATLHEARATLAAVARLEQQGAVVLAEAAALLGGLRAPSQSALLALRSCFEDVRALARQLRLAPDGLLFGVTRGDAAMPPGGDR